MADPPLDTTACPICHVMGGKHDRSVHDMVANNGAKSYPPPGDSPTGMQK
jgi:hypothetical protein